MRPQTIARLPQPFTVLASRRNVLSTGALIHANVAGRAGRPEGYREPPRP